MTVLPLDHLWIVGPGRLGLALGARLLERGAVQRLAFIGRRGSPPAHPVFDVGATYSDRARPPDVRASAVILTVPDASIPEVAVWLESLDHPPVPILHTSGVLGSDALAPVASRGWPVGSLHPLVAIPDPVQSAARLDGAWFGLEGTPQALELGQSLVASLNGRGLMVDRAGKPLYHAAAVFASNYLVALQYAAENLMVEAGVNREDAASALARLAGGALADVSEFGPERALTGPIVRGDAETVALHLRRLSPDSRRLYSELARTAVEIAQRQGLPANAAQRLLDTIRREGS